MIVFMIFYTTPLEEGFTSMSATRDPSDAIELLPVKNTSPAITEQQLL
jgi:hypothetical protein